MVKIHLLVDMSAELTKVEGATTRNMGKFVVTDAVCEARTSTLGTAENMMLEFVESRASRLFDCWASGLLLCENETCHM